MKAIKILLLGVPFSLCIRLPVYADNLQFSQDNLQKFNTTNECPACDLSNAILTGNHSQAKLSNTNLSGVSGSGINLSQANLTNANLSNSIFTYANFSEADLTGTAFYQADFSWANLYNAKISTEQIAEFKSLCNATLPDGSKGSCK